jgi:hypothetical protein
MKKFTIARWESVSGKYWLELYHDSLGFSYRGVDCGGNFGHLPKAEAILRAETRAMFVQPDANKTPMKRVK